MKTQSHIPGHNYTRIIHDSMGEFLSYAERAGRKVGGDKLGRSFYGADSTSEAIRYIHDGAREYETRQTRELLDSMEAAFHGRTMPIWQPDVMGAYPMVPDFLAGMPDPMRRRAQTEQDISPIRIVVNVMVSAGVERHELAKRGAAAAALAIKLSEIRPVELWAAYGGRSAHRSTVGRVRMDTSPVDIAHLVAVLSTPQFARAVTFPVIHEANGARMNNGLGWAFGGGKQSSVETMREVLALDPQDIYIHGGHLTEASKFGGDVVAWIESYLAPQREVAA